MGDKPKAAEFFQSALDGAKKLKAKNAGNSDLDTECEEALKEIKKG